MGFGLKVGGLSLNKLTEINQVAKLAVKTTVPLTNLTVCTKLAENLLYGVVRREMIEKNFPFIKTPLEIIKSDPFAD